MKTRRIALPALLAAGVLIMGGLSAGMFFPGEPGSEEAHVEPTVHTGTPAHGEAGHGASQAMTMGMGMVGSVAPDAVGIDPVTYLSTWNFNNLPERERISYYRESALPGGVTQREYTIYAVNRELEIAPGIKFPGWTYNGQVPGPTIRATEGDRIRIRFVNAGTEPHTMHFHGFHPAEMDGSLPEQFVKPGETFIYEFEADPAGLHLYHCHATPLTQHLHKGLYGVYIVDPKLPRPPAKELVMMMDGFDTNFDGDNEVYAVNGIAFVYERRPIEVVVGEPVRIYLVNILEFDETNSFHIHGNFFNVYYTGTRNTPDEYTDTVIMGQAQRAVLELTFRHPGLFMFHAHKTEFAELGWMGFFRAVEPVKEEGV